MAIGEANLGMAKRRLLHVHVALLMLAAAYGLLAHQSIELTLESGRIAAFWIGNALIIGLLVGRSVSCQVLALGMCFIANLVANVVVGDAPIVAFGLAFANLTEIIIAIGFLEKYGNRSSTFDNLHQFSKFAIGSVIAPIVPSLIAATTLSIFEQDSFLLTVGQWLTAHCLPIPIFGSLVLIVRNAFEDRVTAVAASPLRWAAVGLATAIGTPVIFAQITYPFLFLAAPVVIFAAFLTGRLGTALVVAIFAEAAIVATLLDYGPISLARGGPREEIIALQTFLASCLAIGLPVAVALANRATMQDELVNSTLFLNTILEGVDDLVFKVDEHWRFVYLNRRWEELTGFPIATLMGSTPFTQLVDEAAVDLRREKSDLENGIEQSGRHVVELSTTTGRKLHVDIRLVAQFDVDGSFTGAIGTGTDVTERLARDQALTESEARFRKLAEASPVGIFQADAHGQITYISAAWIKRFGLTSGDLLGDGWKSVLFDGNEYEDDPAFTGFHKPGDVRRRVVRFTDGSGKIRWCETVNAAEFDDEGAITGYVGVLNDITEQRVAAERLRLSEQRFEALANMAPAGIFRTDANGSCTYVNRSWKGLTDLKDGEWEGSGWTKALHPKDTARVQERWMMRVSTGRGGDDEFRFLRSDDSVVWVHVVYGPEYDDAGALTGFIGVVSDVTERKLAQDQVAEREEQLSLLADNVSDTVLRLDLSGVCTYASQSARQIFKISADRLVGHQLMTGFHPEDRARINADFKALATGQREHLRIAFRSESLVKDDEFQWLEANCGLVRDQVSGAPQEIVASLRNIDETKNLEADLLEAKEKAEAGAAAKSAFLANMSHEIRTPMNGVIGFTELLLAGDVTESQKQHLEMIADSGRAMLRLLNDLLDFAKIESGQMAVAHEPTDIRHKVHSAVRLLEPTATEKGVSIKVIVKDVVPKWILSDRMRLRQIVLNLLGNAIKFTDKGSVTVEVSADKAAELIQISVTDTGIGVADDKLSVIFEKFTQADSSIARRFGGTGLGLPICAQLATLLGGSITAKSREGVGSVFTLTLPLQQCDAPNSDEEPSVCQHVLSQQTLRNILVAEDNHINQQLTLSMLEKLGYAADVAENGQDVLDRIRERLGTDAAYDVILMDMQMPVLDGLQATKKIRDAGLGPDRLRIIALTANAYPEDVQACLDSGMQGHLAKPLRLRELEEALHTKEIVSEIQAADQGADDYNARLLALFNDRKRRTLQLIDDALQQGALDDARNAELAQELHKIVGVAAFFGQAILGEQSRILERDLREHALADVALLHGVRHLLAA